MFASRPLSVLLPIGERSKGDCGGGGCLAPLAGASSSSSSSSPSHSTTSSRARCSSFTAARYRTTETGSVEERSSSFSGALANKRSGFVDISGNFSPAAGGGAGYGGAFGSGGSVVGIGSSGSLCAGVGRGDNSSSNSSVAAVAGSGGGSNSSIGSGGLGAGSDGAVGSLGHKYSSEEGGSWRVLVINRSDGQCRSFNSTEQIVCRGQAVCLDPIYNVLWR